jgi:putative hydrolase of the HAD superfamily
MIRGVLFDLGDTLIFNVPPERVHRRILASKGIRRTEKKIRKALEDAERHFYDKFGNTKPMNLTLDEFYIEFDAMIIEELGIKDRKLAEHIHNVWFDEVELGLHDDALPVLSRLSAMGMRLGLVSNGYVEELNFIMKQVGLPASLFSVLVGRDTVGVPKPDPRPFLHAAGSMGLRPDEILYVGDSFDKDYEGARGAGMRPLLLLRGRKSLPSEATEEVTTIKTLGQVVGFIR